jgi:hypothetical protein
MSKLSHDIEQSSLWRATLGSRNSDEYAAQRERLRTAFTRFREHAGHLAEQIRQDMPTLTVHDVTHLDALWEIASIIVGDAYQLTPAEGFVLGGAILLHDLGMSVAATPGGMAAIVADVRWADIVTFHYRAAFERKPTAEEVLNPPPAILSRALFEILRQLHAENAEKLAFTSYRSSDGSELFMLEDTEVRQALGQVMGRIAHSHWWTISDVEKQFARVIGPPSWCPPSWTVDPLKIACILRTADAAHVDARRAPTFLKAVTSLPTASEDHWRFQEKLAKPYRRDDSLVFTSTRPFALCDAVAWWLCLDTLRMVDRELRGVDSLFADKGYPRFATHHVAGVDHPERLASYVQTHGWLPINAMVHVTDLPNIIKSLGGDALYGERPQVALRELIQNGCDAVRARRLFEGRDEQFGSVTISLVETSGEHWLEVTDTGVGMSRRVLTEFLLDFGTSFWGSPQMQEEFPGLLTTSFKSTGKYGVGFFSVFMIADQVQVRTRRSDAAAADTLVLEFASGLRGRPILRFADLSERLRDGGSVIRLKLKSAPSASGGLLDRGESSISLAALVRTLAPAVDVSLLVNEKGTCAAAVAANDWLNVPGHELLGRVGRSRIRDEVDDARWQELSERAGPNMRLLQGEDGQVYGRACISVGYARRGSRHSFDFEGSVCVGGLEACGLNGIAGILIGEPVRASRDAARPTVPDNVLQRWAEEQAELVPALWADPDDQAACAQYIRICGGHTRNLPIAKNKELWLSSKQITEIAARLDLVVILDDFAGEYELKHLATFKLDENVFVTRASGLPGLLQGGPSRLAWPRDIQTSFTHGSGRTYDTLAGAVVAAVADAWGIALGDLIAERDLVREKGIRVGLDGDREILVQAISIKRPSGTPDPRS